MNQARYAFYLSIFIGFLRKLVARISPGTRKGSRLDFHDLAPGEALFYLAFSETPEKKLYIPAFRTSARPSRIPDISQEAIDAVWATEPELATFDGIYYCGHDDYLGTDPDDLVFSSVGQLSPQRRKEAYAMFAALERLGHRILK